MAAEFIGLATCGYCGKPEARVALSKSKLACVTCPAPPRGCHSQFFARGDVSDELARARIPVAEGTPAAPAAPIAEAPAPAPAASTKRRAAPKAPAREPEPAAVKRDSWAEGIL